MGKDRVVICTTLLWSAFKTHDAMATFENANFEDHPSISSEYVKFLAMNSGFEALEIVSGKLKSLQDQAKEFQSSVKQAQEGRKRSVLLRNQQESSRCCGETNDGSRKQEVTRRRRRG
jgi:hypothetical protein